MPLYMIRGDITKISCDAVVVAASSVLNGGVRTNRAISDAADPALFAECSAFAGCAPGEVMLTQGSRMSAGSVIVTSGPVWKGGNAGEPEQLAACYRNSLRLAAEQRFDTVALPLISAGANGYPRKAAQEIAVREIAHFLETQEMNVYLVQYAPPEGQQLYPEIDRWVTRENAFRNQAMFAACPAAMPAAPAPAGSSGQPAALRKKHGLLGIRKKNAAAEAAQECADYAEERYSSLAQCIRQKDESFSQMLLRKIDESGMTDAECYKKANIDRKLFSKIRSDPHYQPKKTTALAFAIALELPLSETDAMLRAAGFAFSHSNTFDLIVEYFIRKGVYDVFTINEALYEYDQLLIGA